MNENRRYCLYLNDPSDGSSTYGWWGNEQLVKEAAREMQQRNTDCIVEILDTLTGDYLDF